MKYNVYSIRDVHVGFGQLMIENNEATAIRNFKYAINANDMLKKNAKDYDLYLIGTFSVDDGRFTPVDIPTLIICGVDVTESWQSE